MGGVGDGLTGHKGQEGAFVGVAGHRSSRRRWSCAFNRHTFSAWSNSAPTLRIERRTVRTLRPQRSARSRVDSGSTSCNRIALAAPVCSRAGMLVAGGVWCGRWYQPRVRQTAPSAIRGPMRVEMFLRCVPTFFARLVGASGPSARAASIRVWMGFGGLGGFGGFGGLGFFTRGALGDGVPLRAGWEGAAIGGVRGVVAGTEGFGGGGGVVTEHGSSLGKRTTWHPRNGVAEGG